MGNSLTQNANSAEENNAESAHLPFIPQEEVAKVRKRKILSNFLIMILIFSTPQKLTAGSFLEILQTGDKKYMT